MKKEKILVLFGADSNLEWGRSYQLAKAFNSLGHEVVYIDLPEPITKFQILCPREKSAHNFKVFQPKMGLPYGRLGILRPINNLLISKQIINYLEMIGYCPTLLWVYAPYEPRIVKALSGIFKGIKIIYDCADERESFALLTGGAKAALKVNKLERELSVMCDSMFVITENLKKIKNYLNTNIHVIPNGIDTEMFNADLVYLRPEEFNKITGKIILYTGTIAHWIDINLVAESASKYPDYDFVMIGPIHVDTSILNDIKNIHLLGPKNYNQMPAYIYYSDLCIIPFNGISMLKYSNSLKSLQYLSMDKKVLATYYEGLNDYCGLIKVSHSRQEFIDKINEFINECSMQIDNQVRNEVLNDYSWKTIAIKAFDIIKNI